MNVAAFIIALVLALIIVPPSFSKRKKKKTNSLEGSPPKSKLTLETISDFDYDDFNSNDVDSLSKNADFDYFESNHIVTGYVESFLKGDYDKDNEEAILLYLICFVSKHPLSKLYKYRINDLTSILHVKYGMVFDKSILEKYRICRCWSGTEPTYNIYSRFRDCIDEEEYRNIYQYYRQNINLSGLSDLNKSFLCLFLLSSRFAGNFGHERLCYIDFYSIIEDFVRVSKRIIVSDKDNEKLTFYNDSNKYKWLKSNLSYYAVRLSEIRKEESNLSNYTFVLASKLSVFEQMLNTTFQYNDMNEMVNHLNYLKRAFHIG